MINIDVLRIIIAKGAGDGTLKKISKCIANDMSYSLNDICNNINLMCSLGIKQEVARNIYEGKENNHRLSNTYQYYFDKVVLPIIHD